jgi:hypothetical protein
MPEGRILGTVSTFGNEELLHVVAGARVSANGSTTVTDAFGRFLFEGVPIGVPIAIAVEGPEDDRERYAANRVIVTVPADTGAVTPELHLLRACTLQLDGAAGTGGPSSCDDRASFDFPAGAVTSEHAVATIAALDPEQVIDRLGFPQANTDRAVSIAGGVSVELTDAFTGSELELAQPVTVRFALAESDVEGELALEWFDEAAGEWIAQPSGRVVIEGDRSFYEFEATHFSTYVAVRTIPYGPNACITLTPAICQDPGCERTVWISMVDLGNQRVVRGWFGPSNICIPAYTTHAYRLYLTHLDPTGALSPNAPIRQTTRQVVVPRANRYDHECITDCTDAGRVVLTERTPGCVTGTFLTQCGLDCIEPYAGTVDVSYDGQRLATVAIPPECSGDVCIPVPLPAYGIPSVIELRTPTGHRLTFAPDTSSRGKACDPFACAPSSECQELGDSLLACGVLIDECLEAKFTATVRESSPACSTTPDRPHQLTVDASATIGRAARYDWKVYRVDEQGDAAAFDAKFESVGRTQFCLPAGSYRVTLTADNNNTFNLPYRSTTSQDVEVGVGLVELSIVASPGTRVGPGVPVTLTVTTPDDPSQYTFRWSRDPEDPIFIGEGTSVTVTPMRAAQAFGVWAFRNGARVGEARIVLEVDTSMAIYVEIETTDIRPRPDQWVTFRPMTFGGSTRDIVSCLYPNITAIRWKLTDVATGDQEETFHEAPAGSVLSCDRTATGPIVERSFYEGRFRMDLAVEAEDGRTGSASFDFEVGY